MKIWPSRAMLVETDVTAKVQEVVFATANLLNLEVDLLLFEFTRSYFRGDPEPHDAQGQPGGFSGWGTSNAVTTRPSVQSRLHVKEAKFNPTAGVRWIIRHNLAQACDAATHEHHLNVIRTELDRITTARDGTSKALAGATTKRARTRLQAALDGHAQAESAVGDTKALRRYLKHLADGRLVIDTANGAATAIEDFPLVVAGTQSLVPRPGRATSPTSPASSSRGHRSATNEARRRDSRRGGSPGPLPPTGRKPSGCSNRIRANTHESSQSFLVCLL